MGEIAMEVACAKFLTVAVKKASVTILSIAAPVPPVLQKPGPNSLPNNLNYGRCSSSRFRRASSVLWWCLNGGVPSYNGCKVVPVWDMLARGGGNTRGELVSPQGPPGVPWGCVTKPAGVVFDYGRGFPSACKCYLRGGENPANR
ncbi:hypothetical protein PR048_023594 [Dryococelus australis]|uniref:Uncharacterized protein n=1 Tax=Dryococelus australis TaxID=614101 RepID=A0ABQ9GUH8_9NEOP|nr:hypothetical protein PR048_023594 [Dryococelus australis]